jgi:hypothetical protein
MTKTRMIETREIARRLVVDKNDRRYCAQRLQRWCGIRKRPNGKVVIGFLHDYASKAGQGRTSVVRINDLIGQRILQFADEIDIENYETMTEFMDTLESKLKKSLESSSRNGNLKEQKTSNAIQLQVWWTTAASAVANLDTGPIEAARLADAILEEFNKRWEWKNYGWPGGWIRKN